MPNIRQPKKRSLFALYTIADPAAMPSEAFVLTDAYSDMQNAPALTPALRRRAMWQPRIIDPSTVQFFTPLPCDASESDEPVAPPSAQPSDAEPPTAQQPQPVFAAEDATRTVDDTVAQEETFAADAPLVQAYSDPADVSFTSEESDPAPEDAVADDDAPSHETRRKNRTRSPHRRIKHSFSVISDPSTFCLDDDEAETAEGVSAADTPSEQPQAYEPPTRVSAEPQPVPFTSTVTEPQPVPPVSTVTEPQPAPEPAAARPQPAFRAVRKHVVKKPRTGDGNLSQTRAQELTVLAPSERRTAHAVYGYSPYDEADAYLPDEADSYYDGEADYGVRTDYDARTDYGVRTDYGAEAELGDLSARDQSEQEPSDAAQRRRKRSRFSHLNPVYRDLHRRRSRGLTPTVTGGRQRTPSLVPVSFRLFPILRNVLLVVCIVLVVLIIRFFVRLQSGKVQLDLPALLGLSGSGLSAQSVDGGESGMPAASDADAEAEYVIELPADLTPIPIEAPSPTPVAVLDREMTEDEKLAAFIYEGLSRKYTRDELIYRSEAELAMIRNGMYALSGKIFERNMEAKEFFENCPWYEGTTTSDSGAMGEFNYYQLQNLQMVVNVEKDKGFRAR